MDGMDGMDGMDRMDKRKGFVRMGNIGGMDKNGQDW